VGTLLTIPWFRPEPIPLLDLPDDWAWLPDEIVVHPFGMLVLMAVLIGALLTDRKARSDGLQPRVVGELAGYIMVGGFVLGHVLDAVFYHWDEVVERPMLLLELHNGLSSFGGFVGAAIGAATWLYTRQRSFFVFADPIAFSFPFGWTFGRLGCFVTHDHPGRVSNFFLAVDDYIVRGVSGPRQPRHDLGLYEAMWSVVIAIVFVFLAQKRRRRGTYLAVLGLMYAPIRFFLDFLRAEDVIGADTRYFGLTPGHYGSIVLFGAAAVVAWRVWKHPEPIVPPDARYAPNAPPPIALITADALARATEDGARVVTYERIGDVVEAPPGVIVTDTRELEIEDAETWRAIQKDHEVLGEPVLRLWVFDAEDLAESDATKVLEGIAKIVAERRGMFDAIAIHGDDVPPLSSQFAEILGIPVWTFDETLPFVVIDRGDGALAAAMIGKPAHEPA
jgi:phosphatidylglycerol:prolipoprotein diacylglycerol transferase